jgi:hypothetical protein
MGDLPGSKNLCTVQNHKSFQGLDFPMFSHPPDPERIRDIGVDFPGSNCYVAALMNSACGPDFDRITAAQI